MIIYENLENGLVKAYSNEDKYVNDLTNNVINFYTAIINKKEKIESLNLIEGEKMPEYLIEHLKEDKE